MIDSVQEVRHRRETLEFDVDAFPRAKGWKHTSSTPGSFWMWEREINGRVLLVDKGHALAIQGYIESIESEAR
ncbi:hypothetical protein [Sorangium sp. So ce388]|uniref:hypothetical protein n=1 Tax=Sorangium sp. So ce388 TaxID=3133309 RepID=UPI003F5C43D8